MITDKKVPRSRDLFLLAGRLRAVRLGMPLFGFTRFYIYAPVGELGRTDDAFRVLNDFAAALIPLLDRGLFGFIHGVSSLL